MKTYQQIYDILDRFPLTKINSHIHTHLCDGAADMTVQNIADRAEREGLGLVILVPHFHKQVTDGTTTLYEDSNPDIFGQLREEISYYRRHGGPVEVLLSTEADILNVDGTVSLPCCAEAEQYLDFVSPTLNYHPLLPLDAVAVTHIREVDDYHQSGRFGHIARAAGGHEAVLEAAYDAMIQAIGQCPYPAMLGHFFISHTVPGRACTWFDVQPADLPLVERKTAELLDVCAQTGAFVDLTGIHLVNCSAQEQREKDGFLHVYQRQTMAAMDRLGLRYCAGSDAHKLEAIGDVLAYHQLFDW